MSTDAPDQAGKLIVDVAVDATAQVLENIPALVGASGQRGQAKQFL